MFIYVKYVAANAVGKRMKSINMMKNVVQFIPPQITKSDLPLNCLYD